MLSPKLWHFPSIYFPLNSSLNLDKFRSELKVSSSLYLYSSFSVGISTNNVIEMYLNLFTFLDGYTDAIL
ncbi:MAG: hypothetical protein M1113_04625 [Candidatus Thermoplasmatota archaeon]|nr:hypothetical protein [Candidatus Thermoplasmatota archaeon]